MRREVKDGHCLNKAEIIFLSMLILDLPMGDVPLDGISVKDLGPCVVTILKHPSHYGGKNIGLSAEKLTVAQYAHIMSEVTGKTIKDAKVTITLHIYICGSSLLQISSHLHNALSCARSRKPYLY